MRSLTLWAFANGYIPFVSWEAHPVYFAALMLLIPLIREVHFYLVHRLIHWPPLYRTVHRLHHYNVNPGPWSGLAMHPGEHLLYFSGVLIHWVVPSHPVHALFHLVHAGLSPVPGHAGFDKVVVGKEGAVDTMLRPLPPSQVFRGELRRWRDPARQMVRHFHDGSDAAHDAMRKRRAMMRAAKAG